MEESKKQVKILLMRHAESTYNVMQSDWKKANGHPANYPEDEPKRFIKTPELIDAILTDLGIQQSKNAQAIINQYPNLELVFSSPLRRAVQTAKICMETYPNTEKNNVIIKVIPWCRETMKSQCDFAFYTNLLKEAYPDIDFSEVEDKFWFLKTYIPSKNKPVQHIEVLQGIIKELNTDEERLDAILKYMKDLSPHRIEDSFQAEDRAQMAKKVLGQQLREHEAKTGKDISENSVLLVAHSNFLRHFTGEGISATDDENDAKPINCHRFDNAEVFEYNFTY